MSDRPDGSPTAVDVKSAAAWAAIESNDKVFVASGVQASGGIEIVAYVVPAGKVVYVEWASLQSEADNLAASGDLNQMVSGLVFAGAATGIRFGGNGGGFALLARPIKAIAGETITGWCQNVSAHQCRVSLVIGGYEADA